MNNDIASASDIQEILEKAWHAFIEYYNEQKALCPEGEDDEYLICWNEYDLMFHIGRFFYKILRERKEDKYSNIHIHFEKNVNSDNFGGYDFAGELGDFAKWLGYTKGPKIDMIITNDDDEGSPFLVCAEIKFFHCHSRYSNPTELDIRKLDALKKFRIAQKTVFILLDDYYCRQKKQKELNDIKNELNKAIKEKEIEIFPYYTSEDNQQAK